MRATVRAVNAFVGWGRGARGCPDAGGEIAKIQLSDEMPDSEHRGALILEAAAVATLHDLNAQRVRALAESDVEWLEENMTGGFICTQADGRRIGKDEFMQGTAGERIVDVACDDVDVRPLGDVALVQGVLHCTRGGVRRSTRYTDVWLLSAGRWQIVAEHLTNVA
jgi:ketosteroid isomerase-like protein